MAAVTDLPFRTVWEEFGVGFTITEFLSAHALAVGDPKTTGKLTASLDGRRFGVQIFGREEAAMDKAAKLAVAIGASLVDINMGCPAKRVVAGECGSALMREPAIAQRLCAVAPRSCDRACRRARVAAAQEGPRGAPDRGHDRGAPDHRVHHDRDRRAWHEARRARLHRQAVLARRTPPVRQPCARRGRAASYPQGADQAPRVRLDGR